MNMKLAIAAASVLLVAAAPAFAGEDLTKALTGGKVSADLRARYETVEQGTLSDANAATIRTRLGYETAAFYGVTGGVEFENVLSVGNEDYNDTVNGKTTESTIADPETTEVNQAYLAYAAYDSTLKVGRQVLADWDNGRFVGDSNWRQNQFSYDAALVQTKLIPMVTATYAYVANQRTNIGLEAKNSNQEGNSHLINLSTDALKFVTLSGYAYLIDNDTNTTLTSNTYGVRAAGDYAVNKDVTALYAGEFARQQDARDNPRNYSLNYWAVEGGVGYKSLTTKVGYEVVEGNGTASVTTPFSSNHNFNGLTDVINTTGTIANGLEDLYVKADVEVGGVHQYVDGVVVSGEYHDFQAENTSADYGTEWNVGVKKNFGKTYYGELVYADFDADDAGTGFVDTQKFVAQVGAKF